jgi:pSer/pThr/pTyr-binding forkhead associated (FHA) protein
MERFPMGRLVVTEGENKGKAYSLGDVTHVGRLKSNEITIRDSKISRKNSKITRVGELFFIEDLQSSNGTLVNGKRIKRVQLKPGDSVQIGKVQFLFERTRPGEKPRAPIPPKAPGPAPRKAMKPAPGAPPRPPAKPPPEKAPERAVASMETPPAGVETPAAAREEESAEEDDAGPGEITLEGADAGVDEIVLDAAGEDVEIRFEAPEPEPSVAAPPAPAPAPRPSPSPVHRDDPYDLTRMADAAQRRRAGLLREDMTQRDWRFQWIIGAVVFVIAALVFYAAFRLAMS